MRILCLLPVLLLLAALPSNAQVAGGIEADFNLYQWHRRPDGGQFRTQSSSGQTLQVITVGPKIWLGDWEVWTVSLEGKLDFAPLSVDLQKNTGMGTLSFPFLLSVNIGDGDTNGTAKWGIGAGAQWTKMGLYARPEAEKGTPNPFFLMYIGEVSLQFVFDGRRSDSSGGGFAIFARGGGGKGGSGTFSFGLRMNMRWSEDY